MTEINSTRTPSPSHKQKILITGVSGLLGRLLFDHLTKTHPTKYEVFGLDQDMNISSRYQIKNCQSLKEKTIPSLPLDRFFQCDITDRMKLLKLIEEQKIDIIIHLAAVLEDHPDLEKILHVNIDGTKNVFEAPGVRRIIYASSIRIVFGYLTREPYLSIFNDTFDDETMLHNLRKLTVADDPPSVDLQTPGTTAYWESKVAGERMAACVIQNSTKSIICVRFGGVNIDDQPGETWSRPSWLSYRDLYQFIDKVLEAPPEMSGTYYATSNNHRRWVDLEDARRDFGFVPQDDAEKQ